jgi:hypothetical protein
MTMTTQTAALFTLLIFRKMVEMIRAQVCTRCAQGVTLLTMAPVAWHHQCFHWATRHQPCKYAPKAPMASRWPLQHQTRLLWIRTFLQPQSHQSLHGVVARCRCNHWHQCNRCSIRSRDKTRQMDGTKNTRATLHQPYHEKALVMVLSLDTQERLSTSGHRCHQVQLQPKWPSKPPDRALRAPLTYRTLSLHERLHHSSPGSLTYLLSHPIMRISQAWGIVLDHRSYIYRQCQSGLLRAPRACKCSNKGCHHHEAFPFKDSMIHILRSNTRLQ